MPSTATITSFYTFTPLTKIVSSQMNTNFDNLRGHSLPINTDTQTSSNLTHDIGADTHAWRGVYNQYGVMYGNTTSSIPSSPPSGFFALYFKENGTLYSKSSGGTEMAIAADAASLDSVSDIKTTGYTATTSDNVIRVNGSSAGFTLTLYTATGNTGRVLKIIRTDDTPANAVTIDGEGSETIRGAATFKLYTQHESVTIESDGSNWLVIDHYFYKGMVDLGAISVTAVTTSPTKSVAMITDKLRAWRMAGGLARLRFDLSYSTAGSGGSGEYYWNIPTSFGVVDTTQQPEFTVAAGNIAGTSPNTLQKSLIGQGHHGITSVSSNHVYAYLIDSSKITVTAGPTAIGSASNGWANANGGILFEVIVPMLGWEG